MIEQYTIQYKGYKLTALNIGACITEYSLDQHNIVLAYANKEDYLVNKNYLGAMVGRSAGRIKNAKFLDWDLPKNYLTEHNIHGNDLHLAKYEVIENENSLQFLLEDKEGAYPGNAKIKIIYTLGEDGLQIEVTAKSDKPTVFNFTNHSYFNLNIGKSVMNHQLQLDAKQYSHLDTEMFVVEDRSVSGSAFDFTSAKTLASAANQGDQQFKITKFIDHPFKLDGKLLLASDSHQLQIETTNDYVVIYAGNYLGDDECEIEGNSNFDYSGICFETQACPGDLTPREEYYAKTTYKLTNK